MGVNEEDVVNIMGGMEHAGGIKLNDHKRKLKNRWAGGLGQGLSILFSHQNSKNKWMIYIKWNLKPSTYFLNVLMFCLFKAKKTKSSMLKHWLTKSSSVALLLYYYITDSKYAKNWAREHTGKFSLELTRKLDRG